MEARRRDLVVQPGVPSSELSGFMAEAAKEGVKSFLLDPPVDKPPKGDFTVVSPTPSADVFLARVPEDVEKAKALKKPYAVVSIIKDGADVPRAVELAKQGARMVIVETVDWKIIPLENLVAEARGQQARVYAKASSVGEVRTLFGVLERGVDGVVLSASSLQEVREAVKDVSGEGRLQLTAARVIDVKDAGMGERACIDTASILSFGEGLLVGSRSNFLFLIHNESGGSKFTAPRPFRVNAGAIHCYTPLTGGRTKYLSEIEAGDEVPVVSADGVVRPAAVGRVKIERRPLTLVKAEAGGESGSVMVQNAETIAFVDKTGKPLPVTELKPNAEVIVSVKEARGRHFGMAVDEVIIEK